MITVDPGTLQPREVFDARVAAYLDGIRATPPAAGFDEVLVPGDRAARAPAAHRAGGVRVPSALWRQLQALAAGQVDLPSG